jgi:hypothetical protein
MLKDNKSPGIRNILFVGLLKLAELQAMASQPRKESRGVFYRR